MFPYLLLKNKKASLLEGGFWNSWGTGTARVALCSELVAVSFSTWEEGDTIHPQGTRLTTTPLPSLRTAAQLPFSKLSTLLGSP